MSRSEKEHSEVQDLRWRRAAIEESVKQIYGAEIFLDTVSEIAVKDRTFMIALPERKDRRTYRIAIAFGGENRFPLETSDFGKSFVHVFDEESTFTVLNEMDTVSDFLGYLRSKESFIANRRINVSREVDFLGIIHSDRVYI